MTQLNAHLMCVLCGGYLVDATTIVECLHSFCKSCIVKYMETSKCCPICDTVVHKTKPHLNLRMDKTLQDIVYKLVPGLFTDEMKRRRDFYASNPEAAKELCSASTSEDRGEVDDLHRRFICNGDETISLSLEYTCRSSGIDDDGEETEDESLKPPKRYLRCPAAVTIEHLKKLLRHKYSLQTNYQIDVMYGDEALNDYYTLMDIAYLFTWRRKSPLPLTYRIRIPRGKRKLLLAKLSAYAADIPAKQVKLDKNCDDAAVVSSAAELRQGANPPTGGVNGTLGGQLGGQLDETTANANESLVNSKQLGCNDCDNNCAGTPTSSSQDDMMPLNLKIEPKTPRPSFDLSSPEMKQPGPSPKTMATTTKCDTVGVAMSTGRPHSIKTTANSSKDINIPVTA